VAHRSARCHVLPIVKAREHHSLTIEQRGIRNGGFVETRTAKEIQRHRLIAGPLRSLGFLAPLKFSDCLPSSAALAVRESESSAANSHKTSKPSKGP